MSSMDYKQIESIWKKRNKDMKEYYDKVKSYVETGKKFGVSRQRAHEIVNKK